jgi:hypothetical protein
VSFDVAVIARVAPGRFSGLLELGIDAGRLLLEPVRESLEGSFVERFLRVTASDLPSAVRALGLPATTPIAEWRDHAGTFELLVRGRINHRDTIDAALVAMAREREDASFEVERDPTRGELRVTGKLASTWAYNGWLEPLLLVAMAATTLGGEGRAAFFADGDDFEETFVADVYRVESGRLVTKRLDPPNDGFEATREAFAAHGLRIETHRAKRSEASFAKKGQEE